MEIFNKNGRVLKHSLLNKNEDEILLERLRLRKRKKIELETNISSGEKLAETDQKMINDRKDIVFLK